jgi:3-hydroxybutyryl-CoA dehydrogenase
MNFTKVLIIGAGQMGAGIAQVMAQSGLQVVLRDIKEEYVQKIGRAHV